MAYDSKTDRRPRTGRRTCKCDYCFPEMRLNRRAQEKRAWLADAWTEARFGDMDPRHAAMPAVVEVKFTPVYDEDYACF